MIKLIFISLLFLSSQLQAQWGHWEKLEPTKNPGFRSSHGMAPIGKNKVLLFGGDNGYRLNDTWIFDLEKREWEEIDCKNSPPERDGFGICQISENQVLIFGGSDISYSPKYDDLWLFDLDTMDWKKLIPKGWLGDIFPTPIWRLGMAKLTNNSVIIFGGYKNDTLISKEYRSSETWIYHIDSNTWELFDKGFPNARLGHMMAEIDSSLVFMFGGDNGSFLDNYYFDNVNIHHGWRRIYDLKRNINCLYMSASAFCGIGDGFGLLHGGLSDCVNSSTWYDSTWIFNYYGREWIKLDLSEKPSDRLRPRMARIDSNKVLLFGGSSKTNPYPNDTWLFVLDSVPTSVDRYNNDREVLISPNPASDYIEINNVILSETKDPVIVYDLLGIKYIDSRLRGNDIFVSSEGNVRIDISSLSPGVYFVRIGKKVYKFVKM